MGTLVQLTIVVQGEEVGTLLRSGHQVLKLEDVMLGSSSVKQWGLLGEVLQMRKPLTSAQRGEFEEDDLISCFRSRVVVEDDNRLSGGECDVPHISNP